MAGGKISLRSAIANTERNQVMSDRPNIIYINSHDTGRYIQPFGHDIPTPNLQALAEEGTLFRHAYCVNPTCSASRSGLVTGQSPHQNGMLGLAHRGFKLNNKEDHIQHLLREAGYHTCLAGVQHVTQDAPGFGYSQVYDDSGNGDANAELFLDDSPDQPFYLELGFEQTHRGFPDSTGEIDPRYVAPVPYFPDTPEMRKEMADFQLSAKRLDERMGRVFAAVERNGLAENTLIICTTDHGIAFPRMKCNLVDGGIGVFLIMRGPGVPVGGVVDSLVSHVDIFPTICEMLQLPAPERLEGTSICPILRGETDSVRTEVFVEVNFHASSEPMRAVRTERYKYIQRFEERERPVLTNCDESPSKTFWLANGWCEQQRDQEMLFDTYFDPTESHNLINDPRVAEVAEDLRGRLRTWMTDTDDELLKGPLPIPSGARLNDVDGKSPGEQAKKY